MEYEYWFANLKGLSNRRKTEIRATFSAAGELYNIEEKIIKEHNIGEQEYKIILESIATWNLKTEYENAVKKEICCIPIWDARYPKRLKNISSAPYALYVKGQLPREDRMTVAIVGARECSAYGQVMAKEFGKALAEQGVQIISGMARGVDSEGQLAALEAGGESFGVLGCGVDICYPKEKIDLYVKLQRQGGIISELPPGTNPQKQYFPARNRIISGLADAVLVMEAKERSGSLITADMALEQGKEVYALPGPVNSRLSRGCNELIRQGANVLLSPEELLKDFGFSQGKMKEKQGSEKILLETQEDIVYSCLGFYPQNPEQLKDATGLPVAQLLNILLSLELKGYVKEITKNYYVKAE